MFLQDISFVFLHHLIYTNKLLYSLYSSNSEVHSILTLYKNVLSLELKMLSRFSNPTRHYTAVPGDIHISNWWIISNLCYFSLLTNNIQCLFYNSEYMQIGPIISPCRNWSSILLYSEILMVQAYITKRNIQISY